MVGRVVVCDGGGLTALWPQLCVEQATRSRRDVATVDRAAAPARSRSLTSCCSLESLKMPGQVSTAGIPFYVLTRAAVPKRVVDLILSMCSGRTPNACISAIAGYASAIYWNSLDPGAVIWPRHLTATLAPAPRHDGRALNCGGADRAKDRLRLERAGERRPARGLFPSASTSRLRCGHGG